MSEIPSKAIEKYLCPVSLTGIRTYFVKFVPSSDAIIYELFQVGHRAIREDKKEDLLLPLVHHIVELLPP